MSTAHDCEIYDGWAFCCDCLAWNHTYHRREEVGLSGAHPDGYALVERCAECDRNHLETEAEPIVSAWQRYMDRVGTGSSAVQLALESLLADGGLPGRAERVLKAIVRGAWPGQRCRGCQVVSFERRGDRCPKCADAIEDAWTRGDVAGLRKAVGS